MPLPASPEDFAKLQTRVQEMTKSANKLKVASAQMEKSQDKQIEFNKKRLAALTKRVDDMEKDGKRR